MFAEFADRSFDTILSELKTEVDSSNSIDLVLVDYELSKLVNEDGEPLKGQYFAKRFRDTLPSVDIIFYSGKKTPEELRGILAEANVDCVNCLDRGRLGEDAFTVIENVINRSCKISTLRGLVLNSVCDMDNMIVEVLCKYAAVNAAQEAEIKTKSIDLINERPNRVAALRRLSIEELLLHKKMMSGKLFSILSEVKNNLGLSRPQVTLLNSYRSEILDLRTSAAHAIETTCPATGQAMLKFKDQEYKRINIDNICKTIVTHEDNIQSILAGMV